MTGKEDEILSLCRNTILEFKYNGKTHHALVYGVREDGRVLCFRVVQKQKLSKKYIPIYRSDGESFNYQVQYGCRFVLPDGCYTRQVGTCSCNVMETIKKKCAELPSLASLIEEYKNLQKKIKTMPPKEAKELSARYNKLNQTINDRSAVFLQEKPKSKVRNKYSNYRVVPDKAGIRTVCQGGKVSPK